MITRPIWKCPCINLYLFFYRPSDECPTPYEALKQKKSLDLMLTKAKPIKNDSITSFKELRKDVLSELYHHEQVAGVKVTSL